MPFQFLAYHQIKANIAQFRREWIAEFQLDKKEDHLDDEQQLDKKHFKLQLNNVIIAMQRIEALVSKLNIQKGDKQSNVLQVLADDKKAKMLTAQLMHLRESVKHLGEVPDRDLLFYNVVPFIIGETSKNVFDEAAKQEAQAALLLLEPLSFAKLEENIRKLRLAEIKKYSQDGILKFENVPAERQAQLNQLEQLIIDLKGMKTLPDGEKAKILMDKLFLIREEIETSYRKGLLATITSVLFGSKPEDSELYRGILPAMGIMDEKWLELELVWDAKHAYQRFTQAKQHTVIESTNKKIETMPQTDFALKKIQPSNGEAINNTDKLLFILNHSRAEQGKQPKQGQVEEYELDTQYHKKRFYHHNRKPVPGDRVFINPKTKEPLTLKVFKRPTLTKTPEPIERQAKLVMKDLSDPRQFFNLKDTMHAAVKERRVLLKGGKPEKDNQSVEQDNVSNSPRHRG